MEDTFESNLILSVVESVAEAESVLISFAKIHFLQRAG